MPPLPGPHVVRASPRLRPGSKLGRKMSRFLRRLVQTNAH